MTSNSGVISERSKKPTLYLTVVLSAFNAWVLPAAMQEERGNQHVGEGGGRRGGSQTVSPTQLHNKQSVLARTAENRAGLLLPAAAAVCSCKKPHMEAHVTANSTLCWNSESTGAPTAGLTARRNQWPDENRNTHFTHMYTQL